MMTSNYVSYFVFFILHLPFKKKLGHQRILRGGPREWLHLYPYTSDPFPSSLVEENDSFINI